MSKTFCSECGNEILGASKFCPSCGHPVEASPTQPQPQQPEQQHSQQTPPTEDPSHGVKPNNNFMILVIIAGIVGIGLLIYFWQKEAPEDVAEQFFTHITKLEIKEAEKFLSSDADWYTIKEIRSLDDVLGSIPKLKKSYLKTKSSFKITDIDKSGKKATVWAEVTFLDNDYIDEAYFELKKEKGNWKILYFEYRNVNEGYHGRNSTYGWFAT